MPEEVKDLKEGNKSAAPGVTVKTSEPATSETEADKSQRDGVITGDRSQQSSEQFSNNPEKQLPIPKLGDNPNTGK